MKTSHDEKRTMHFLGASADMKRQSVVKTVHERSNLGETVSLQITWNPQEFACEEENEKNDCSLINS